MFGRTIELRRAMHQTAVRVGLIGAIAIIALSCLLVVTMQTVLPGGHFTLAATRLLVPVFAVVAILSAAITVFASPLVFRSSGTVVESASKSASMFMEALQSDNVYERAAGQLGLLAIVQMIAAAIPTLLGFGLFVVGAHVSVFSVFVALSVVILAAVCPRASEWDDAVERLVAEAFPSAKTAEDGAA